MIFVDTSGWFAMTVPTDQDHLAVAQVFREATEPLLTTDYIVDETLTLLQARGYGQRANALGEALFSGAVAELHYLSKVEIQGAWQLFRHYRDKKWSFTDCSSKIIIESRGITQAISLDHHFRQFGNLRVLPESN